jgi:hypothetical protein
MGTAKFIQKHFMGRELCVSIGASAETISYEQSDADNKEYFRGIVKDIDNGILTLEIKDSGIIYINCYNIQCFWQHPFDYYHAINTSITRKPIGVRKAKV